MIDGLESIHIYFKTTDNNTKALMHLVTFVDGDYMTEVVASLPALTDVLQSVAAELKDSEGLD